MTENRSEPSGIDGSLTSYGDPEFSRYIRCVFLASAGYGRDDLDRPIMGIADTSSDYNTCHRQMPELVDAVKRGVLEAGGLWKVRHGPTLEICERQTMRRSISLSSCPVTSGFARGIALAVFATGILSIHAALAQSEEPSVNRPPREGLIVNLAADALVVCTPFGEVEKWARFDGKIEELSREEVLEGYRKQIDRYAGTQVSHIFLNANYQRACYPSDVWDTYWDIEDPNTNLTGWQREAWQVHRHGVDLYAVCIEHCRARGISPWVSMRMNDTHYIDDPHKANTFWKEHPEYRCRQGLNFALPEVRRHHLNLVEELLARYDVDGIELDWMRFPDHHVHPGAGCTHLNEMMREVRQMADEAGRRRGRPVQVAARIPAIPDVVIRLGMDGVTWVKKGWIDMLIASPVWRPSDTDIPIKEWRKRIGKVDRPYQIVAATDLWIQSSAGGKLMLDTPETARGFAAAHLDRGADQIYLFNHFDNAPTNARIVRQAGTLETAVAGPRRHVLSFHYRGPPPPLPATITSDAEGVFHLPIGPKPEGGQAVVRVGLESRPDLAEVELECRVNDTFCPPLDDLASEGAVPPDPFVSFVLRTNRTPTLNYPCRLVTISSVLGK